MPRMHQTPKRTVYMLRSGIDPSWHHVGITDVVDTRLEWHNRGSSARTTAGRPWSLAVALQFPTEKAARRFEKYLKSGSGRAFAKRHFAPDESDLSSPANAGHGQSAGSPKEEQARRPHLGDDDDDDADAEAERWLRYLDSFENGPFTTEFERLTSAGLELPHPDGLTDEQLPAKLWEVIRALAEMGTFITSTDHLDDRALYTRLWTSTLRDEVPEEDGGSGTWHVDLLGGWSREDVEVWLTYYADDDARHRQVTEYPEDVLPARRPRPCDRDRHLPRPPDEQDRIQ